MSMHITATQLEAAFAAWVKDFQEQAREQGEDGVIDFHGVDAPDWARKSTPYFWTLLRRATESTDAAPASQSAAQRDQLGVEQWEQSEKQTGRDDLQFATLGRVIADIGMERGRQTIEEGYTVAHDDSHANGELADAAACYCVSAQEQLNGVPMEPFERFTLADFWPWEPQHWKPKSPRQDLVRAAALIVAEIERIDRRRGGTLQIHPTQEEAAKVVDTGLRTITSKIGKPGEPVETTITEPACIECGREKGELHKDHCPKVEGALFIVDEDDCRQADNIDDEVLCVDCARPSRHHAPGAVCAIFRAPKS